MRFYESVEGKNTFACVSVLCVSFTYFATFRFFFLFDELCLCDIFIVHFDDDCFAIASSARPLARYEQKNRNK